MTQPHRLTDPSYHQPRSVEDLTRRNVEAVARLEQAEMAGRGVADRVADAISRFCGSVFFLYVHVLWYGFWLLWNGLPVVPKSLRFDPFPYQFLTLVVSLEAIFLSTFILISQNQQARLDTRRNQLDLQINLLSEQENSKMLALLGGIARKLGIEDDDPEVRVLEEATQPEAMVAQIREVMEESRRQGRAAEAAAEAAEAAAEAATAPKEASRAG